MDSITNASNDKNNKIINNKQLIKLLPLMTVIEYNQSTTTSEKIQTNALIGAFKKALES